MSVHAMRLAAICAAVVLVAAPGGAQSLGELARRTQEQRDKSKTDAGSKPTDGDNDNDKGEKDKKEKKVYTDHDLKALPPIAGGTAPAAASSDGARPSAAATSDTSADTSTDVPKGEAYWRARWMPRLRSGSLARVCVAG